MNQISSKIKLELSKSLTHSKSKKAIEIINNTKLDVNTIIDTDSQETIIFKAINPLSKYFGSDSQLELVKFIIEKGANLNVKNRTGYSPLFISISHHNLSKISLILLNEKKLDVESNDRFGTNLIFVAIREYGLVWRPEQKETQNLRFKIIEKLLERNANLDKKNNFDVCARNWIERCQDEKLNQLINDYDTTKNESYKNE